MGHRMYPFRQRIEPLYNVNEDFRSFEEDFLDVYWTTNLPDHGPPGCGVALLCIPLRGRRIRKLFRSDCRSHAEEHLIDHLWTVEGLHGQVIVEVFQNYSPCGICAKRYCQLMEDFRNHGIFLKIEIHFVSLYRICLSVEAPFDVDWYLTKRIHWSNVKGLQKLSASGIILKGFTRATWLELIGRMCVPLHGDFDRQYDKHRATSDSFSRKQLEKVLACPRSSIPEDTGYWKPYRFNNNYNYNRYNSEYNYPHHINNDRYVNNNYDHFYDNWYNGACDYNNTFHNYRFKCGQW